MTDSLDRMAQGYEPRFDIDAEVGRQGEMYVYKIVDAISGGGGIEVKTDEKASVSQRVYVEYACKTLRGWMPSGIASTSAELWAFVVGTEVAVVAPTARVKEVARWAYRHESLRKECKRGSHPTRGVVIPLNELIWRLMGCDGRAA